MAENLVTKVRPSLSRLPLSEAHIRNTSIGFCVVNGELSSHRLHLLPLQGHPVLAFDVTAEAVSDIVGKGAQGASGPAQVSKHTIEIFYFPSILLFL